MSLMAPLCISMFFMLLYLFGFVVFVDSSGLIGLIIATVANGYDKATIQLL